MTMKFADLVSATNPRAAGAPALTVPRRADRAAKSASNGSTAVRGSSGTSKADGPGISARERERQELEAMETKPSRFAHWARPAATTDKPVPEATIGERFDQIPSGHGMRAAAIREAVISNQGHIPGADTPEKAAAFVAAAAAKARGRKA